MTQKMIAVLLKAILVGVALCAVVAYAWTFPAIGQSLVVSYPEFSHAYYPWLVLLWATAIPCCVAWAYAWVILSNIGSGSAFTEENSKLLKRISILALTVSLFFFVMNVLYLLLSINHPGILLLALIVVFVGLAAAAVCAGLSHLTARAAELQIQSDWTI